jgi:hypothetical protein
VIILGLILLDKGRSSIGRHGALELPIVLAGPKLEGSWSAIRPGWSSWQVVTCPQQTVDLLLRWHATCGWRIQVMHLVGRSEQFYTPP